MPYAFFSAMVTDQASTHGTTCLDWKIIKNWVTNPLTLGHSRALSRAKVIISLRTVSESVGNFLPDTAKLVNGLNPYGKAL